MSQPECFSSLPLKFRYTSGEHAPLHDFCLTVLRLARHYDRAAGYFSSNAFVVTAQGMAHLIAHGGTIPLSRRYETPGTSIHPPADGRTPGPLLRRPRGGALVGPLSARRSFQFQNPFPVADPGRAGYR